MAKILVVDDIAELRGILCQHLAAAGHDVAEAGDASLALVELNRDRFDLVITDILMPGADGFELINAMRRSHPGLPVIATSGGGRTLDAELALRLSRDLGALGMLRKPVRRAELLEAVAQALAAKA